jgi:hypothetical protein
MMGWLLLSVLLLSVSAAVVRLAITQIFMDLDRVAHGEDLVKTIGKAVASSDQLIAVIGRQVDMLPI